MRDDGPLPPILALLLLVLKPVSSVASGDICCDITHSSSLYFAVIPEPLSGTAASSERRREKKERIRKSKIEFMTATEKVIRADQCVHFTPIALSLLSRMYQKSFERTCNRVSALL